MISVEEYKALKFNDWIEVVVRVGDTPMEIGESLDRVGEVDYNLECFRCTGFFQGGISVLVPLDAGYNCWTFSRWTFSRLTKLPGLDPDKFGGWWIDRDAINAWFAGKRPSEPKRKDDKPIACCECKQFYPYAEPNLEDKLVCWSCRDSLGWKYGYSSDGAVFLKK